MIKHLYKSHTECPGDRTFAPAGPRLWNCLPVQLRNPDITYQLFRWQLKGHIFGNYGHGALWLLICSALEQHLLTYLLTVLYYCDMMVWSSWDWNLIWTTVFIRQCYDTCWLGLISVKTTVLLYFIPFSYFKALLRTSYPMLHCICMQWRSQT